MPSKKQTNRGFTLVKLAVAVVVVGAIGGGAYMAFGRGPREVSHGPGEVGTAAKISFDIALTASGELHARKQTEIRSTLETETAIMEIVPEGNSVKKGDVLVKLNSDDIQKQLDAETLELESAKSELVSAENGYSIQVSDNESAVRKAQLTLDLAELDLKKWINGDDKEKMQELELALKAAQQDFDRLQEKLDKAKALYERKFLSYDEWQQDLVSYTEAERKLKTSQTQLEVYTKYTRDKEQKKLSSDVDEARAELDRVKKKNDSELSSKEATRTKATAEKAQRERQLAKFQKQLEACTLIAPTDGLVVYATSVKPDWYFDQQGPLAVGRKVHPNETLIVLPDTSEMLAQIKIHESLISKVKPGQTATINIDAVKGKPFTGKVESIGIMAESGGWNDPNLREYEVKIAMDLGSEATALKPSMRCEAQVITDRVENTLAVPLPAVFMDGPRSLVYAVRGGKYQRLPVKVGRRSELFAEIKSGIENGEKILLREPLQALVLADQKGDFKDEGGDDKAIGGGAKPGAASAKDAGAVPASAEKKPIVKEAAKPVAEAKPVAADADKDDEEVAASTDEATEAKPS